MPEREEHLVSIITPMYNAEKYVAQTIASIQAQTYSNWELLVVDDHSTDGSFELVENLAKEDDRIRLLKTKRNGGPALARNTAMEHVKGRFIAFLDSDDLWHEEKLSKQTQFLLDNDLALSYTFYEWIQEDGVATGKIVKSPTSLNYKQLLRYNYIGCLTAMYDSEKTGYVVEEPVFSRHDYLIWLNILKQGYVAKALPEVLAYYRMGNNSISSNKVSVSRYYWKVIREHEELPLVKSIFYYLRYGWIGVKRTFLR